MTESPDQKASAPEPWPYVSADASGWPTAEQCAGSSEFAKALCEAKLEVRKKRTDAEIERAKAERAVDLAVEQAYYQAVLDVAKGAIDRSRASAEMVQKAAAAVVTLYTGILALTFAAASHPLPFRALFAALFLGLAVALSTAFLAYLPDPQDREDSTTEAEAGDLSESDTTVGTFVLWTRAAALRRAYPLRASVLALAGALLFLPAPFVQKGSTQAPAPKVTWPGAPTNVQDPELQKILYTAQVKEAANARNAPVADQGNDAFWTVAFFVVLAIVLAVPAVPLFKKMFRNPDTVLAAVAAVVLVVIVLVGVIAWTAGHYTSR